LLKDARHRLEDFVSHYDSTVYRLRTRPLSVLLLLAHPSRSHIRAEAARTFTGCTLSGRRRCRSAAIKLADSEAATLNMYQQVELVPGGEKPHNLRQADYAALLPSFGLFSCTSRPLAMNSRLLQHQVRSFKSTKRQTRSRPRLESSSKSMSLLSSSSRTNFLKTRL
jgi:hypothetical protein